MILELLYEHLINNGCNRFITHHDDKLIYIHGGSLHIRNEEVVILEYRTQKSICSKTTVLKLSDTDLLPQILRILKYDFGHDIRSLDNP